MKSNSSLSFLSFDNRWKMRIDHPYSLLVRDGAFAWSCGQCPLDEDGAVLFPGNLLAQADAVAGFIEQYLGDIGCAASVIGRLLVYYVKTRDGDASALQDFFHGYFGPSFCVLPVAIPHFYYEGMLVEVDVHGCSDNKECRNFTDAVTEFELMVVDAGDIVWANFTASALPLDADAAEAGLQRLLVKAGLSVDCMLSDQWFECNTSAREVLHAAQHLGLCRDQRTVVGVPFDGIGLYSELTFSKSAVQFESHKARTPSFRDAAVQVTLSRSKDHFHVAAADEGGVLHLVAQTGAIMEAVELTLRDHDLKFADVRKATTYYVAGSNADALHDNMQVRNRYYTKPGPASTGLPVQDFPHSKASIRVQMLGSTRNE
ncbi:MAG: RidA family protein [Cypionkella sp.]|uniref:hypothetical protein n=1 Tax=Cypionkella sp. TaxID=2811411 RepID=UPI00262A233B|nr:hypothetical protein [Cypionkella sp.]MDB5657619.1 RidA family protein [Cypionkella sp.]